MPNEAIWRVPAFGNWQQLALAQSSPGTTSAHEMPLAMTDLVRYRCQCQLWAIRRHRLDWMAEDIKKNCLVLHRTRLATAEVFCNDFMYAGCPTAEYMLVISLACTCAFDRAFGRLDCGTVVKHNLKALRTTWAQSKGSIIL